jgi:hypothetical protein
MLSVILTCFDPTLPATKRREGAVRSLASLVPCVVEGLVADAAMIGPQTSELEAVADEAGCELIAADNAAQGLRAALARARCADVLLLAAGYAVPSGFGEAARDAVASGGLAQPRVLRLEPYSVLTRLSPSFARPVGLLARKDALVKGRAGLPHQLTKELRVREFAVAARICIS